jgi:hypothetical protein
MSRINGTGRMAIAGVSFHDQQGKLVDRIWTGDSLRLRIAYRCQEEVLNPVLDLGIMGPGGVTLFQGSNLDCQTELGSFGGEGCLEVEIERLNVNNHQVEFFITLWNRGRTEMFDWKRYIPFRVDGVATSTGLLRYEMKWRNRGAATD